MSFNSLLIINNVETKFLLESMISSIFVGLNEKNNSSNTSKNLKKMSKIKGLSLVLINLHIVLYIKVSSNACFY